MTATLDLLTRNDVLRVAINTGNRALVQTCDKALLGVSPALARRLAATLGVRMEPVVYSGAGKVFADAEEDIWDVAFLAIDATRAKKVSFTRPYHAIEATYAVRTGADITHPRDADRDGRRILTSSGSAYDMYLSATLERATLDHSGSPTESFEAFRNGKWDAVAGVRASLERAFAGDPKVRILPGVLTSVEQAMVLPGPENPAIGALDRFVADAIADGFIARELAA